MGQRFPYSATPQLGAPAGELVGSPETGSEKVLINTDYLVVGAGASGLAFADALVAEADVEVTLIDRRHAPGGHWLRCVSLRSPAHPLRATTA